MSFIKEGSGLRVRLKVTTTVMTPAVMKKKTIFLSSIVHR